MYSRYLQTPGFSPSQSMPNRKDPKTATTQSKSAQNVPSQENQQNATPTQRQHNPPPQQPQAHNPPPQVHTHPPVPVPASGHSLLSGLGLDRSDLLIVLLMVLLMQEEERSTMLTALALYFFL